MTYIKQFAVATIVFLLVDLFWLGFVAKKLYRNYLGHLMADKFILSAAGIFYIVFIIGLLYFVIQPGLAKDSLKYVIFSGMLFGFVTYATYDLTNLATLRDWPIAITLIDLAWGTTLSGLVSVISYLILRR